MKIEPSMELLDYKLTQVQKEIASLVVEIKENVVTRKEFDLRVGRVETIMYSVIGVTGTAIIGAVMTVILK